MFVCICVSVCLLCAYAGMHVFLTLSYFTQIVTLFIPLVIPQRFNKDTHICLIIPSVDDMKCLEFPMKSANQETSAEVLESCYISPRVFFIDGTLALSQNFSILHSNCKL